MSTMPPQDVAEFMYAIDNALASLEERHPDEMIVDVRLYWHGEYYAVLREEGWNLL